MRIRKSIIAFLIGGTSLFMLSGPASAWCGTPQAEPSCPTTTVTPTTVAPTTTTVKPYTTRAPTTTGVTTTTVAPPPTTARVTTTLPKVIGLVAAPTTTTVAEIADAVAITRAKTKAVVLPRTGTLVWPQILLAGILMGTGGLLVFASRRNAASN